MIAAILKAIDEGRRFLVIEHLLLRPLQDPVARPGQRWGHPVKVNRHAADEDIGQKDAGRDQQE